MTLTGLQLKLESRPVRAAGSGSVTSVYAMPTAAAFLTASQNHLHLYSIFTQLFFFCILIKYLLILELMHGDVLVLG